MTAVLKSTPVDSALQDLFAFHGMDLPTPVDVKKVKAIRSKPVLTATTVPLGVASEFLSGDMFGAHLAITPRSNPASNAAYISKLSASSPIPSVPEVQVPEGGAAQLSPEDIEAQVSDEDLDSVDMGPKWSEESLLAEQLAWLPSDPEIMAMHASSLEENLAMLHATDAKDRVWREKAHVLQWIFTVDDIDGVNVRSIPFSFHNCCICSGIWDVDAFRLRLLQVPMIRDLLVNLNLYQAHQLPKLGPEVVTFADIVGHDHPSLPTERIYLAGA